MGDANLKCVRCDLRGPASSFRWVRAMGWCCSKHPAEAHPNVLKEWFRWARRRAGVGWAPTPITARELRASGGEEE